METIKINPEECEIFGNIISNKHGYLEDKNDFESHKSFNPSEQSRSTHT